MRHLGFIDHDGHHAPKVPFKINQDSSQARGLVAWWPMVRDDGKIRLQDFKAHFTPMSVADGATIDLTPFGGFGLKFNGTDDSANSGGTAPSIAITRGTNDFSIFLWGTTTDSSRRVMVSTRIGAADGYRFYKNDGTKLELQLDDGVASSVNSATTMIIDDGLPHIWGVTADRAALATFYEDGITHGTADISARSGDLRDASTNRLFFGKNKDATTQTWDNGGGGLLWDIRIYDYVVPESICHDMFVNRWDLYEEIGRQRYHFLSVAAAAAEEINLTMAPYIPA